MDTAIDTQVRLAAFNWLAQQTTIHGEVLPLSLLRQGFEYQNQRVPLAAPQGIFTPKVLDLPLTFLTVPPLLNKERPYNDELGEDGTIRYRYRGTDPKHRDNVGLRRCMEQHVPLIYLYGIVPGQYMPIWPAYIVGDDPAGLSFSVIVDDSRTITADGWQEPDSGSDEKRRYITVTTQKRCHQTSFRNRVLAAYRERCAVCALKHAELLEGAHIIPDGKPGGEPVIPNGLALCKIHHAAYDRNIMGISPDLVIDIREDILLEHDGPMLKHGLQEMQGVQIRVPRVENYRPDRDRLDIRYQEFRAAG